MLVLVGSNHQSAPVALRERMAFRDGDLGSALRSLLDGTAIAEAMILSTCNRVEILVRSDAGVDLALGTVHGFLSTERGIAREELERHGYHMVGLEAVRHLFGVAGGLDSMILGEPQILGQVKRAYADARQHRATGPVLDHLLQQCLATAKRIRSETGIGRHAVSVAFAAVKLAGSIFGDLSGRSALLIGAGKMSGLVAQHLTAAGVSQPAVTSRTYNHAVLAAKRCGGTPVHWDDGLALLKSVDIVVSCTAAPDLILHKQQLQKAIQPRRRGPLFIVDIAVPRDVDPRINDLDNVYLYDIDGLQGVVKTGLDQRRAAAVEARKMIEGEVLSFDRWRQSREIAPLILTLRESLLGMGQREIERYRRKLGQLSAEQEKALEQLTMSVIRKILHGPMRHLKRAVEQGSVDRSASEIRSIFGLEERPASDDGEQQDGTAQPDRLEKEGPRRLLRGGKSD